MSATLSFSEGLGLGLFCQCPGEHLLAVWDFDVDQWFDEQEVLLIEPEMCDDCGEVADLPIASAVSEFVRNWHLTNCEVCRLQGLCPERVADEVLCKT
jgi:hypothetical protein